MLLLRERAASERGADEASERVAVFILQRQSRVLNGLPCGDHGELGETVQPAGPLGVHELEGIEVAHLRADAAGKAGGVESRDVVDGGLRAAHPVEEAGCFRSDWGQRPQTRHDYPAHALTSSRVRAGRPAASAWQSSQ